MLFLFVYLLLVRHSKEKKVKKNYGMRHFLLFISRLLFSFFSSRCWMETKYTKKHTKRNTQQKWNMKIHRKKYKEKKQRNKGDFLYYFLFKDGWLELLMEWVKSSGKLVAQAKKNFHFFYIPLSLLLMLLLVALYTKNHSL